MKTSLVVLCASAVVCVLLGCGQESGVVPVTTQPAARTKPAQTQPQTQPRPKGHITHVVYVIDRSGSMMDSFDYLKNALADSISRLRPSKERGKNRLIAPPPGR